MLRVEFFSYGEAKCSKICRVAKKQQQTNNSLCYIRIMLYLTVLYAVTTLLEVSNILIKIIHEFVAANLSAIKNPSTVFVFPFIFEDLSIA